MPASRSTPVGLVTAVFLGTFMALLDLSVVNVALPAVQSDLDARLADVQWIVDGYALGLSAFMLTGGALGDRFGRKKTFLTGLTIFTLASLACALAPTPGALIAARLAQGIGASAITPGALSLLAQGFPDPARRARIIGLWGAVTALAVVLGPLLGGALTDTFGWPAIFLINLPLGALALIVGLRGIEESADPDHAATDPLGQLLAVLWLAALTYAVIDAGHHGWTQPRVLTFFGIAAVAFLLFLLAERRSDRALLPLTLFRDRSFALVNTASLILGFGAYGTFYLLSLYLQQVQDTSAVMTGVKFLPYSIAIALASTQAGRLTATFGPRRSMLAGYGLITLGLLALLTLTPGTPYAWIAIVFTILGTGMGLAITPTNAAALAAVPRQRSGAAAATVNATRQTGTALGIALLGSLLTTRATTALAHDLPTGSVTAHAEHQTARALIDSQGRPWDGLPLEPGTAHDLFAHAFTDGLRLAVLIAGTITLAATAAVAFLNPTNASQPAANSSPTSQPAPRS
ncbi:MFS transporter [Streptomyces litchfieldiae]|uniref:MFS transporter n=1 Tax=Streptomyces litchfieldiae TaxID=3075543 RepID=A0ABU2N2I9_9ACTN|nr:MFS transporter [Streptomyces sp. DSM 44938]MDT0347519.1 MFS transporter [Streptomyces sp. DSM 44938]